MKSILSTKILTTTQRQLLVASGFEVVEKEMIAITPISIPTFKPKKNLLFTSQQAVKSVVKQRVVRQPEEHTVFCVGEKTRRALEDSGFSVNASFDNAKALGSYLIDAEWNDFDFFCGDRRLDALPQRLQEAGIAFCERVVYSTQNHSEKIETPIQGILFFSPSGVESFLEKNTLDGQPCFCIGSTTAQALAGLTQLVFIAPTPSIEATITICLDYFKC
jgi:uroporphyrinogen-III synthase